jgi:hypothetical protein
MGIPIAAIHSAYAQQLPTESQVKAAYLFNFLKFVEWPDETSTQLNHRWIIGVAGDDLLSDELTHLVSGKVLQGRLLQVKGFLSTDDPHDCHILFIGASETKRLAAILTSLRGSSVLTVGDTPHFMESGGMIQFVRQDDRVSFMINVGATERAGLKVSSKLLALARAITGAERSPRN